MQLIDTHTHINLKAFAEDSAEVFQRAFDSNIVVINVGTQIDTSRTAVTLLDAFPENVYAVVGLHPSHTYTIGDGADFVDPQEIDQKSEIETEFNYDMYKDLVLSTVHKDRVVGIGECGLDYYRLPEGADVAAVKKQQYAACKKQIQLALELDTALCIHCRPSEGTEDAYEELLEILQVTKDQNPQLRFEVHCYTGGLEMAEAFIALGGYIGINGIITFDRTSRSEEVIKGLPIESLILETDAPYLAPKPYRGKRNEPAYIVETAKVIAEWKGLALEEVASVTTTNAKKLFKL
jgi:TatD DNase family protein